MSNTPLDHPALVLFQEFLSVPSPSGREDNLAKILVQKIQACGFEPEIDYAGNVLVRLPGANPEAPLCILAAHIDEIGFVVTRIEADGSLIIDCSGGLIPWKMGERPVEILGDHQTIVGVLSMGSGHSSSAEKPITWQDIRILTGLTPAKLHEAGVRPGSGGVPLRSDCGPVVFGESEDPLVAAWTFDDRMGAITLVRLLEVIRNEHIEPHQPTIIAFTTQEEIGGQGAKALAQREKPVTFIAVDGCPVPPGSGLQLDGRPGIWSKDRLGYYDQKLVQAFLNCARQAGTELQPVVYDRAASDASMVGFSGGAQRIAVVGHVRENSHGFEVARLSVFDNLLKVLVRWIQTRE